MVITQSLLDQLTGQAKNSLRLRMDLDLRDSEEDGSQRMFKAIEPGSPEIIHRHRHTSETVVCIRGRVDVEFYDELERVCTDSFVLTPNGTYVAVNVPAGQWHGIRAVESGSVVLTMKDGKYEQLSDADILSL